MATRTNRIENNWSPNLSLADVSEAFCINEHLTLTNKLLFRDVRLNLRTTSMCGLRMVPYFVKKKWCFKDWYDQESKLTWPYLINFFFGTLWINFLFMDRLWMVYAQKRPNSRSTQIIGSDVYLITEGNLCLEIGDFEIFDLSQSVRSVLNSKCPVVVFLLLFGKTFH